MIVTCAQCGQQYDASALSPGAAVACSCGDVICVPTPDDLEDAAVVQQYMERFAAASGSTAAALAVEGGWEFIAGSAVVRIEHDIEAATLTVRSSLLPMPDSNAQRLALFTRLLEHNHRDTGEARFALLEGEVVVSFSRPTLGLDYHEFQRAVDEVARVADDFDDELQSQYGNLAEIDLSDDEL